MKTPWADFLLAALGFLYCIELIRHAAGGPLGVLLSFAAFIAPSFMGPRVTSRPKFIYAGVFGTLSFVLMEASVAYLTLDAKRGDPNIGLGLALLCIAGVQFFSVIAFVVYVFDPEA
ncbi:MAG: hypothetical protein ACRDD1_03945 [Planctomycetia bacterium]